MATPDASIDAGHSNADIPAEVDGSLSAPYGASLVGEAADGRTLLEIRGWEKTGDGVKSTNYFAVLDARQACIEETIPEPTLARGASTVPQGLAQLASESARTEISRLWEIAQRFGLREVLRGRAIFGVDESFAIIDHVYWRDLKGAFSPFPLECEGKTPSPDGSRVACNVCGRGPLSSRVCTIAIIETRTRKTFRHAVPKARSIHNLHWTSDGNHVYVSYDDREGGPQGSANVCIAQLDGHANQSAAREVKCFKSPAYFQELSIASPGASFVGLALAEPREVIILKTPGGEEVFRTEAAPFMVLDAGGRLLSTNIGRTPSDGTLVRLVSAQGEQSSPGVESVGFLRDGRVLVMKPSASPLGPPPRPPLSTLRERRCGVFAVWSPARRQ